MHRLADQAELDHGTMVRDESRVRRAAGCRQSRLAPGGLGDGGSDQIGEWPRLGHEHAGVRWFPLECEFGLSAGCLRRALFDQLFQRIERVVIVETDIEARACLAGNEIDCLVADIDRSELEM